MRNGINRLLLLFFTFILLPDISNAQDKLFPEIKGWEITVENQVYDANNLWDLIDGAADLFLEYSFVDLHYARFKNADGIEIKAELYKHGSELDAFGMYSQERDPGYHFIRVGTQGYLEEGVLNYLDGIYYVKLSTLQKGAASQEALLFIAKEINRNLKQNNHFPKEVSLLPAELKQNNSEKYVSQNFLGYAFLKSVTLAKYEAKVPFTAFIVNAGSPENAGKILKQYLETVSKENIIPVNAETREINDSQNGLIDIGIRNNFLFGLIGCNDKSIRDTYLEKIKLQLQ